MANQPTGRQTSKTAVAASPRGEWRRFLTGRAGSGGVTPRPTAKKSSEALQGTSYSWAALACFCLVALPIIILAIKFL